MSYTYQPISVNIINKAISIIRWFMPSSQKLEDLESGIVDLHSVLIDEVNIDNNGNINYINYQSNYNPENIYFKV